MGYISNPSGDSYVSVRLKTADETVNNSNVLQNDDDLFFTAAANTTWMVDLMLIFDTSAAADLRFDFSLPVGASGRMMDRAVLVDNSVDIATDQHPSGLGAGVLSYLNIKFYVAIGANAGDVQFRWSQWTAEVSNTIVKAGSNLVAVQVG